MIKVAEIFQGQACVGATLTLPFEERQKSRLRTKLDDGKEAALLLPRGTVLRQGDLLKADNGLVIEVHAAMEEVTTARTKDFHTLARACYHLGNRHIPLQIGDNWLRYLHDHVLDEMVRELGLDVHLEKTPFEPEAGAYQTSHGHNNGHNHT